MFPDNRPSLRLSDECWTYLDTIGATTYALGYTFLWTDNLNLVQAGMRQAFPDLRDDGFRCRVAGHSMVFTISDGAIDRYKEPIQEFVSFGAADRMLGAYENYVLKIVGNTQQTIPQQVASFAKKHRKHAGVNRDFLKEEVGRGLDFLSEVFGYRPDPDRRRSLQMLFQLRNITVHNAAVVDQTLCNLVPCQA